MLTSKATSSSSALMPTTQPLSNPPRSTWSSISRHPVRHLPRRASASLRLVSCSNRVAPDTGSIWKWELAWDGCGGACSMAGTACRLPTCLGRFSEWRCP